MFEVVARRTGRYFSYLSLSNILLIGGQMLRPRNPMLDYMAAFSLLGLYLSCGLFLVACALALLAGFFDRIKISFFKKIVEATLVGLLVCSWANILRMLFASHGIQPLWLPSRLLLIVSLGLGFGLCWIFYERLLDWLAGITKKATVLSVVVFAGWFLTLIFFNIATRRPAMITGPLESQTSSGPTPNIVCIILDGLTSRDMSLYGYPLKTTPHLEELTRTWTVYDNAHSAGTGTSVNLPAVMMGRYPSFIAMDKNHPFVHQHNLLEALHSVGYETIFVQGGTIGPNFHHFQFYFDTILRSGTGWYLDRDPLTWFSRINPSVWAFFVPSSLPMEWILPSSFAFGRTKLREPFYRHTTTYLQKRSPQNDKKPFFLYMHMLRPHAPYLANEFQGTFLPVSEGFATLAAQLPFLNFPRSYTAQEEPAVKKMRLRYDENILKADKTVNDFMSALKKMNLYDSAMIIITADHGTSFSGGTLGYYSPKISLPEHSIPLLIKFPNQTAGRRISGLVSTVDIVPTVLNLLNISSAVLPTDGKSLLGPETANDENRVIFVSNAFDSKHSYAALYKNLQLTQRRNAPRVLFDMMKDPEQKNDLRGQIHESILERALDRFAEQIHS